MSNTTCIPLIHPNISLALLPVYTVYNTQLAHKFTETATCTEAQSVKRLSI